MTMLEDWTTVDRTQVRGWLEDATLEALALADTLPDTLIARAQALNMPPLALRIWIYDRHPEADDWSMAALEAFARRMGFAREDADAGK